MKTRRTTSFKRYLREIINVKKTSMTQLLSTISEIKDNNVITAVTLFAQHFSIENILSHAEQMQIQVSPACI